MSPVAREVTASWVRELVAREPADPGEPAHGGEQSATSWLQRLCRALVSELRVSGAAVALVDVDGLGGVVATSDPRTAALLAEQFSLGEGPAVSSHETGHPVLHTRPEHAAARWPAYAAAETHRGVRAEYAVPLQLRATHLGVLDVVARHVLSLDARQVRVLLTFADVAVDVLLEGYRVDEGRAGGDDGAVTVAGIGAEVYQAQGMVMVDLAVPLGTAMVRLRGHAFATGRPLTDVAHDVVAGQLRLRPDAADDDLL